MKQALVILSLIALCMTIAKEHNKTSPYLLAYYLQLDNYARYKDSDVTNILKNTDSTHFLETKLVELLKSNLND